MPRSRVFGNANGPLSVVAADDLGGRVLLESFRGVLSDRREHEEAALGGLPQEALVDQRAQGVEIRLADLLCGLEVEAAGEHGQPAEQPLLLPVEEFVAPVDRPPQRPLTLGSVADTAAQ